MKLDINWLKENATDFASWHAQMLEDERQGNFTHDQDTVAPDSYLPVDENFPYLRQGWKWWWKQKFYNHIVNGYTRKINRRLTHLKIVGRENLKGIKGAIVTCNHISRVDSFAVRAALKKKPMMYVAAAHNNWRGYLGDLARSTGYIPLPETASISGMRKFNEAITYYLRKNRRILIFPEQAMWREYPKPRPLQNGAFHYAAVNHVPVVPMFITLSTAPVSTDSDGRINYHDYTIHVLPPIYPDENLAVKENVEKMKAANFAAWRELYEKTYQCKLDYSEVSPC